MNSYGKQMNQKSIR